MDYNKRDPRALKYWREKGYDIQAIASLSECFMYIDILIKHADPFIINTIEEIKTNLFRENEDGNGNG